MKVRISTPLFEEKSLMVCVEDDELGEKFLFGIDYDSVSKRKKRFWLYDSRQEWVLIHDSENCTIEKLK
jgi:hypothetical protein